MNPEWVARRNKILHDLNEVAFSMLLKEQGTFGHTGPPQRDTLLGGMHKARIVIGFPEFSGDEIRQSKDWLDHKGWSYTV